MVEPFIKEQVTIIRRIAERGIQLSFANKDSSQLDLWQHIYDESHRLESVVRTQLT